MLFNVYFSAKGTTQKCANYIADILSTDNVSKNLLDFTEPNHFDLTSNDVLLLSMPVYGGFIPHHCIEMIKQIKGNNTPAIILAIFGNRHFDNALLQMQDLVEANGFKVIAAGAFLAEHSIFPSVAQGRPDADDYAYMKHFAEKCSAILSSNNWQNKMLIVPGDKNYDPTVFKGVPFHPEANDDCTNCQKCVNICPMHAINASNPKATNAEICISCGACIKACPVKARDYHSLMYKTAKAGFELKCKEKKYPSTFFIADITSYLTPGKESTY